jgi:hypothetical protein
MCAVQIAHLIWNLGKDPSFCEVRIQYRSHDNTETKYYRCNVKSDGDRFTAEIIRSGGGLSCTITAKLGTNGRVEMTHSTQHISGLREEFTLAKNKKDLDGGKHYNSLRYGEFGGKIGLDDVSLSLECQLRNKDGKSFTKVPYDLTVTSKEFRNKNLKDESTKFK